MWIIWIDVFRDFIGKFRGFCFFITFFGFGGRFFEAECLKIYEKKYYIKNYPEKLGFYGFYKFEGKINKKTAKFYLATEIIVRCAYSKKNILTEIMTLR